MSMMANNMLCVVEQPLKQPMHFENIFWFKKKVVLIVGNLAQLFNILFITSTCKYIHIYAFLPIIDKWHFKLHYFHTHINLALKYT